MTQSTDEAIWMTPEALEAVQAELDDLTGTQRAQVIERIASARDEGDLKENGGYHAAKEEQGKIEARIRQLDQIIALAHTEPSEDDGVVGPGKLVATEPRFSDDDKRPEILLAQRIHDEAYSADLDVISPQSPLGSALLGATKGETVDYVAPNGNTIKVTVVDVTPYSG